MYLHPLAPAEDHPELASLFRISRGPIVKTYGNGNFERVGIQAGPDGGTGPSAIGIQKHNNRNRGIKMDRDQKTAELVYDQLELLRLNKSIDKLRAELNEIRDNDPRIFDTMALAVRRLIVDGVRKGYSKVGGREAVTGLRADLIQSRILLVNDTTRLDDVLNEAYDEAFKMGQATAEVKHSVEADWRVEFYKAIHEATTLVAIYGEN